VLPPRLSTTANQEDIALAAARQLLNRHLLRGHASRPPAPSLFPPLLLGRLLAVGNFALGVFAGPTERRVEVAPRGSISVELLPGSYKLVGRVNAPNVLPSYGEHVFDASKSGVEFYIQ
jgi:hypothetical protein